MAIRALVAGGRFDYVPDTERKQDEATATLFECRVLSAEEAARLSTLDTPKFFKDGSYELARFGEAVLHAVRCGLVGWRNLVDGDGVPIPFVGRRDAAGVVVGATEADIDRLPHELRLELFTEIKVRSTLAVRDFR